MNYKIILALDPSGNFEEGKGTTGVCLFDASKMQIQSVQNISATQFTTKEDYWKAHLDLIKKIYESYKDTMVVIIEDFLLDPRRMQQQTHSKMETPKLIGILQLYCQQNSIVYKMQRPVDVKNRWNDKILEYKKYILPKGNAYCIPQNNNVISRHCKDAIRHAVHFATFYNKEK